MTGALIKRGTTDTEPCMRKIMKRYRKIAIYKPRKGAWNRLFPCSS